MSLYSQTRLPRRCGGSSMHTRWPRILCLTLSFVATFPLPSAAAQNRAREIHAIVDSLVQVEALDLGVPSVGVTIVSNGTVVVQRSYGAADPSVGRAATVATTYNVASVTKPLTAALALQLVAEGSLELDDPVQGHLPELPSRYADITVRQLLSHTSGIARDLRSSNADDPDAKTYWMRLDSAQVSAEAGKRFEYSNTGYTVLGWLVEAVAGAPLEELYRRRLFGPLEMKQASYRRHVDEDALRAMPHDLVADTVRQVDYVSGGFGSGGVAFSVADAARFASALQGETVPTLPMLQAAWSPTVLSDGTPVSLRMFGRDASYGFGWFLADYDGHRLMTHGGAIQGFSANLYHFPDEALTIVVLANTKAREGGAAPVDPLARSIADACLTMKNCRVSSVEANVVEAVRQANRRFSLAYLAGDSAAIRTMYVSEALGLTPGATLLSGSGAMSRLFGPPARVARLDHALYTERLVHVGDTALELGTWFDKWRTPTSEQAGSSSGRYMLTWVKVRGEWLMAGDAWVPAVGR